MKQNPIAHKNTWTMRRRNAARAVVATLMVLPSAFLLGTTGAGAAVPPMVDAPEGQVTSDALPTVQVNGVVWDQAVVGNTVYAVGEFTKARPAGAAEGTNETNRTNILAYNLSTGALITSFAPTLNGAGRTVEASPDGSRIFVGGSFTQVNGINQYRISALNPQTGAVDTAFSATVDYRVNSIAVTESTVYVGGRFGTASSSSAGGGSNLPRRNLAAFDRYTGAVKPWNPDADSEVLSLVIRQGDNRVFVGGKFNNVGGVANVGLASVNAESGAVNPWAVNQTVKNSGNQASILNLSTDGTSIFGVGYHFGSGGNLEGTFSADPVTGKINWIQDCHGDTYDVAPLNGTVYTVSHVHFCGNIGGFPQSDPWGTNGRYALALGTEAAGTVRREPWGYFNWQGFPSPAIQHWYPDFTAGSIAGQAGWTIEGNDDYVVVGGEFTRVNNTGQQGLVRFARKPIAPANDGPRFGGGAFPLNVTSPASGTVRITFPANIDRDNKALTYRFMRDGNNASPIHITTVESTHWSRPAIGFTDTNLTPGATHSYTVSTTDADGNTAWSAAAQIVVSGNGATTSYHDEVFKDGPVLHWRFGDNAGANTAAAGSGTQTGTVGSAVQFGVAGAITGDTRDSAARFSNNINSRVVSAKTEAQDTVSVEAWVRTTSSRGGRIMGFSNSVNARSGSYDRHLYMNNNGSVSFGAYPGTTRVVTSGSGLNNGAWHHVVGTLGDDGLNLYVDGVRVASDSSSAATGGQAFYGYWRVGADNLSSWPGTRTDEYFAGDIDEPAVYQTVLSPSRVAAHYTASGRTPNLGAAPGDLFGSSLRATDPVLYYRLSEGSGTTAQDTGIRANTGTYVGTVGRSVQGAVPSNTAANFTGGGFVRSPRFYDPGNYTVQAWFNTTSSTGGQIVGFGDATTGQSSVSTRQVYMRNDGRLVFRSGSPDAVSLVTADSYRDGAWHHVAATQGIDGMRLYVDGTLVASGSLAIGSAHEGNWRIGGDNTYGDSSSANFSGRIDEVLVHDRVLPQSAITTIFLMGGGELPNVAPVASFSRSASFLDVSVDATASTDADGSIVAYEWDFGDGSQPVTNSSPTAAHSYAEGGTYSIQLTVTDDRGGTGTTVQQVTVAPEPPNVAPIPSFTAVTSGLSVNVDASGSIDPDGSIVSFDWDFGDGGSGTGPVAAHNYSDAGDYDIVLTVTDDDGESSSTQEQVTVAVPTGPVVHAADAFGRTTASGWGSADVGGAWTLDGAASRYRTDGSVGQQILDVPGRTTGTFLGAVEAAETTTSIEMSIDKPLTGGGIFSYVAVRRQGNSDYQLRVRAETTQTSLTLYRNVGGAMTALASTTLSGVVLQPGVNYVVELVAEGSGPTQLSARIWNAAAAKPDAAQVSAVDATPTLQSAGGIGLINYASGSITNAPLTVSYDNLKVQTGQDLEVPEEPEEPEEPTNAAPTAQFVGVVDGLQVSVDAAGSTDSDGSIESYDWDFGDGTTDTGVTAEHTYATSGQKVVTLVVTDDQGASATATWDVTVTQPGDPVTLASDSFERTATNGWGTADLGGQWSLLGIIGLYNVGDGVGRQVLNVAGRTTGTYLDAAALGDVQVATTVSIDKPLTGGGIFSYANARRSGTSEYLVRVRAMPTGTQIALLRTVNGVSTVLSSVDVAGLVMTPGTDYRLVFSAIGSSPTALSAKLWAIGSTEPISPQVTATDSTSELQGPGGIGLTNYLSGSTTNAPLTISYDDLTVTAP